MSLTMSNHSPLYLVEEEMKQNEYEDRDRLSELPDDIVISILSFVPRKEATRCTILAKRWRYMATYITSMEFEVPRALVVEYLWKKKSHQKVKGRFVNWVNQVVTLHHAPFIYDFKISFPFDATYSEHINSWIKFAMAKRVKKLELDFEYGTICKDHRGRFFELSKTRYSLPSNVFNGSSYLTSICLKFVDISEEVLELLLSRCHSLERLHIERTSTLSNMKIINLGRKLKYLAIHECSFLEKVILNAVSLESFEFINRYTKTIVVYASVPSLVEAHFCWQQRCSGPLPYYLGTKNFPRQLSKLSLDIEFISLYCSGTNIRYHIVCFPNVKKLSLRVLVDHEDDLLTDLLPLMCFAEGCPLLHKLKLQLIWHKCCCSKGKSKEVMPILETLEGTTSTTATLLNLRKIEWRGAFSVHDDLEYPLALYCVKKAINLEKFICDPRYLPSTFDKSKDTVERAGRRRAKRLAMAIPRHIEYVIL